ncbi:lytic transglycosylase domain-containing protein [Falsochrobactrum sp. TDYN1]|uniref:Lytic transglycosylase domain-containing protein n=1 Tax=Falsochrobactrum tianjinense TaxID=2706015 RepID=A0A949PLP8_9HYPH|nr:lytic transglycosylase domain-containing protein [Falsochrobactrum sp. TDYN1]MBV2142239.1 lytic transglycosylase domain-containing protein [Falsochrobactrum sp. TDYN1]
MPFSFLTASFARKGLLLLGCAVALSACNTTNDGKAVKTALMAQADTASQTQSEASLADPVLPSVVPVPGVRGQAEPMLAFADAQAEVSPVSVAANVAFKTPDHAPDGLDDLIRKYSVVYEVPERLVRRVVHRESRFNPGARNGPYWGLMQISHPTARGMGYRGSAQGLLNAETNLKYAVRYLSGAYKVAGGDESQAVRYYARGYYYDAKRKGMLRETGLDGSFRKKADTLPEGSAVPVPAATPIQASFAPAAQ